MKYNHSTSHTGFWSGLSSSVEPLSHWLLEYSTLQFSLGSRSSGWPNIVFHLDTPGKLDYKNVLKKEQLVTSSDYLSADGGCQVITGFPAPKPRDQEVQTPAQIPVTKGISASSPVWFHRATENHAIRHCPRKKAIQALKRSTISLYQAQIARCRNKHTLYDEQGGVKVP